MTVVENTTASTLEFPNSLDTYAKHLTTNGGSGHDSDSAVTSSSSTVRKGKLTGWGKADWQAAMKRARARSESEGSFIKR